MQECVVMLFEGLTPKQSLASDGADITHRSVTYALDSNALRIRHLQELPTGEEYQGLDDPG